MNAHLYTVLGIKAQLAQLTWSQTMCMAISTSVEQLMHISLHGVNWLYACGMVDIHPTKVHG